MLWITNPAKSCAVYCMRAGKPGAPVFWDYHVVLLTYGSAWQVWDLDTTLGLPVALADYLKFSFRIESGALAPRFRLVPAEIFRQAFRSDRQHMHTDNGWLAAPPSWPALSPAGTSNLEDWINLEADFHGEVCELSTLLDCLQRQRQQREEG